MPNGQMNLFRYETAIERGFYRAIRNFETGASPAPGPRGSGTHCHRPRRRREPLMIHIGFVQAEAYHLFDQMPQLEGRLKRQQACSMLQDSKRYLKTARARPPRGCRALIAEQAPELGSVRGEWLDRRAWYCQLVRAGKKKRSESGGLEKRVDHLMC